MPWRLEWPLVSPSPGFNRANSWLLFKYLGPEKIEGRRSGNFCYRAFYRVDIKKERSQGTVLEE